VIGLQLGNSPHLGLRLLKIGPDYGTKLRCHLGIFFLKPCKLLLEFCEHAVGIYFIPFECALTLQALEFSRLNIASLFAFDKDEALAEIR
jgi:hypothetical protein